MRIRNTGPSPSCLDGKGISTSFYRYNQNLFITLIRACIFLSIIKISFKCGRVKFLPTFFLSVPVPTVPIFSRVKENVAFRHEYKLGHYIELNSICIVFGLFKSSVSPHYNHLKAVSWFRT